MTTTDQQSKQQKMLLEQTLLHDSSAIKHQLNKIDSLQMKIRLMQQQLSSLNKVQKSCDKKNQSGLHKTLVTIRNKVNLTQSHMKLQEKQQKQKKIFEVQKNKIKQLRQKELEQLQNAKKQNKKLKQTLMKEVKQISSRNQSIIRKRKQELLEKNKFKAITIKEEKQNRKQSLIDQKIKGLKQKHQIQMSRSQLRLQKKSQLQTQLTQLSKKKQMIEQRVEQKKQYHKRLQSLYSEIGQMSDQQIKRTVKQIKNKIKIYEVQNTKVVDLNKTTKSNNTQTNSNISSEMVRMGQKIKTKHDKTEKIQNSDSKSTLNTDEKQYQKDEEYIKIKMFQKYLQNEQRLRAQKQNFQF